MTVDFSVNDPNVYVNPARSFSEQNAINALVEWKRFNTTSAIDALQKGLIPQYLSITWDATNMYFMNGSYTISNNRMETCLQVNGIVNNILMNNINQKYFSINMTDGYNTGILQPFLLFINKSFIPWSRITVVKSDSFIYLIISNLPKTTSIQDIQIISIPFNIIYAEGQDRNPSYQTLYQFDNNGNFSFNDPQIFVYNNDETVVSNIYSETQYKYFDMGLYTEKITPTNLIIFDETGKIDRISTATITNANLLTLNNGAIGLQYISCCYSTKSNLNEAHTSRNGLNVPFVKSIINGSAGINTQFDINEFISDFDFSYNNTLPYYENLANSQNYIFEYDENKLDRIFESIRPVNIVQYNIADIITRYNTSTSKSITMLKDTYKGYNLESFPIIFHNGLIPEYYSNMEYTQTSFSFTPDSMQYSDTFEIAYFRNISNRLIPLNLANNTNQNYLNITNCPIPQDDIVVFSGCRGDENLFPLNYTLDSNDNIILQNPNYLQAQLYIGSRNQFIYEKINPTCSTNIIPLSLRFRTGFDASKYIVFINGQYLNDIFYRVLIPSMNNNNITTRAIYTMKTFNPGDRIEVFYCSVPKMTKISTNGDLVIQCGKTVATQNNQNTFTIPVPFESYPIDYDTFFCIKNSTYIDKSQYTINGNTITFTDSEDSAELAQSVTFVFPYYSPTWINTTSTVQGSQSEFITRQTRVTENTNTVSFVPDAYGSVTESTEFHILMGSTYVEPDRYTLIGNDTIQFSNETVPNGTNVSMVIESDQPQFSNNDLIIDTVPVVVTEDNQYIYNIPETQYADSFFIMKGSILVSPDRYIVTAQNQIIFVNGFDTLAVGRTLLFCFVKNKNDTGIVGSIHLKTDYIFIRPTQTTSSITIPSSYYPNFTFTNENIILFINSTAVTADRYTLKDNVITLITEEDSFIANKSVVILIAYETTIAKQVSGNAVNMEMLIFTDVDVPITSNGENVFPIPYPNLPFTDTAFFMSVANTIITPNSYSSDGTKVTLSDATNLIAGHQVRFTFVHNQDFTAISKQQVSVPVSVGQTEIPIPSPFGNLIDLTNRMIVTCGNTYIDPEKYLIDSQNRQLLLVDDDNITATGRSFVFTFFYTGNDYNGSVAYLPQSGYVTFLKEEVISNYNKEMYLMFVNGYKIPKSEIIDISNNLAKINTDIQSRYDLVVINCSPTIVELENSYISNTSSWTDILEIFPI